MSLTRQLFLRLGPVTLTLSGVRLSGITIGGGGGTISAIKDCYQKGEHPDQQTLNNPLAFETILGSDHCAPETLRNRKPLGPTP